MKTLVLQHVPFEGPGSILSWLKSRESDIRYCHLYEDGCTLPEPESIDLLVIMGGPMSVNDEAVYPWLRREKELIKSVIQLKRPVVGICLGAQLIANALGTAVYAGSQKEIGWFPIVATQEDRQVFRFPATATVFHWHGETFDLPPNAVRLASSAVCANQAFQVGTNVIGLQFHLETVPETAELMLSNCSDELVDGTHIQTAEQIRSAAPATYQQANTLMAAILDYVTKTPY